MLDRTVYYQMVLPQKCIMGPIIKFLEAKYKPTKQNNFYKSRNLDIKFFIVPKMWHLHICKHLTSTKKMQYIYVSHN